VLGLVDVEHTRGDGYQSTDAQFWSESGYVAGGSTRFNGGFAERGASAWLYNGATTVRIGFTDDDHTNGAGRQQSLVRQLNESGHVIGNSTNYVAGFLGSSAWLFDGSTTKNIGFTGPGFTSPRTAPTSYTRSNLK
jgi:hypothetical protein